MKRDVNLIRVILLSVEGDGAEISSEDNKETVNYHLHLMIEGGLLNGKEINEGQWQVYGLTWEGCELLELIRDNDRWKIIKRISDDLNCYSFEIIRQIATQQMKL